MFVVKDVTMGGRSLSLSANQRVASDIRGQGIAVIPVDDNGKVTALDDTKVQVMTSDGGTAERMAGGGQEEQIMAGVEDILSPLLG